VRSAKNDRSHSTASIPFEIRIGRALADDDCVSPTSGHR
jgi:hypothetical protein